MTATVQAYGPDIRNGVPVAAPSGPYVVRIMQCDPRKQVRELGPFTNHRTAERAERGALRNLDMDNFYTVIVATGTGAPA